MSLIYEITSATWWKAASIRALRTVISVLLPFITATTFLDVNWAVAGSTVGLAAVASYLTSLAGLKELSGDTVPKYVAILVRGVKQFAQTAVSFIGASVLLSDVDWKSVLLLSASAAVVSGLQGVLTELPEQESKPVAKHAA